MWDELKARRRRVESVCRESGHHRGSVQGVFVSERHRLAYCFVPKAGCTFWKRVFGFLNNDTGLGRAPRSPFHIPRLHIHLNAHAYGRPWKACKDAVLREEGEEGKGEGSGRPYLRFMFSRDPYSR